MSRSCPPPYRPGAAAACRGTGTQSAAGAAASFRSYPACASVFPDHDHACQRHRCQGDLCVDMRVGMQGPLSCRLGSLSRAPKHGLRVSGMCWSLTMQTKNSIDLACTVCTRCQILYVLRGAYFMHTSVRFAGVHAKNCESVNKGPLFACAWHESGHGYSDKNLAAKKIYLRLYMSTCVSVKATSVALPTSSDVCGNTVHE